MYQKHVKDQRNIELRDSIIARRDKLISQDKKIVNTIISIDNERKLIDLYKGQMENSPSVASVSSVGAIVPQAALLNARDRQVAGAIRRLGIKSINILPTREYKREYKRMGIISAPHETTDEFPEPEPIPTNDRVESETRNQILGGLRTELAREDAKALVKSGQPVLSRLEQLKSGKSLPPQPKTEDEVRNLLDASDVGNMADVQRGPSPVSAIGILEGEYTPRKPRKDEFGRSESLRKVKTPSPRSETKFGRDESGRKISKKTPTDISDLRAFPNPEKKNNDYKRFMINKRLENIAEYEKRLDNMQQEYKEEEEKFRLDNKEIDSTMIDTLSNALETGLAMERGGRIGMEFVRATQPLIQAGFRQIFPETVDLTDMDENNEIVTENVDEAYREEVSEIPDLSQSIPEPTPKSKVEFEFLSLNEAFLSAMASVGTAAVVSNQQNVLFGLQALEMTINGLASTNISTVKFFNETIPLLIKGGVDQSTAPATAFINYLLGINIAAPVVSAYTSANSLLTGLGMHMGSKIPKIGGFVRPDTGWLLSQIPKIIDYLKGGKNKTNASKLEEFIKKAANITQPSEEVSQFISLLQTIKKSDIKIQFGGIAEKNKKRKLAKGSRALEDGEIHYKNANFMGPGTKEKYVRDPDSKPYNKPDGVAKQHDLDYYNIDKDFKNKKINEKQRQTRIRTADDKMIDTLKKMGRLSNEEEEEYRQVGLQGIKLKNLGENLFPSFAQSILPEGLFGQEKIDYSKIMKDDLERKRLEKDSTSTKKPPIPQQNNFSKSQAMKVSTRRFQTELEATDTKKPLPKINYSDLPNDLKDKIMAMRLAGMKDAKAKREYNKVIAEIYRKQMENKNAKISAKDRADKMNIARRLEEMKKPILSNIIDPHMQFARSVPTGRHVTKKLKKKPLDNFKLSAAGTETSFKKLINTTLTTSEIKNQQRRRKIFTENDHFDKKGKNKKPNQYNYKRIG